MSFSDSSASRWENTTSEDPDPLLLAIWQRDREITGLKNELERVRSQVWRFATDLLDDVGVLERALAREAGEGHDGLRRMISRLKGVL